MLEAASLSVPGSVHPYEDRVLDDEKLGLFAVADGVTNSSQGSGGTAAELALGLLRESFRGDLVAAIEKTHGLMARRRKDDRNVGETTLTAAAIREGMMQVGNVGDSPAYLAREGGLSSLIEADKSPYGFITQVIGYPEVIHVHSRTVTLQVEDVIIIASDGVDHVLRDPLLQKLAGLGSREAADLVVREAQAKPTAYDDDKSVIVIRIVR